VSESRLYTPAFWIACAIHFTGGMSLAMFVLFPLFIRRLGGDELTIGLVLGTGLAASVVLRPAVGALLDGRGRRGVLLWAAALNAVSWLLFLLLERTGPGLYLLAGLHLMVGGALFAGYLAYAADLVPPTRRAEGIAILGVAGMAPNGLGPALGEVVIARAGYPAFFVVASAFGLLSLGLTALIAPRRGTPRTAAGGGTRAMAGALFHGGLVRVMAATLLFGAGINAAFYFLAPFTRDLGLARAAPFFAAYASTTIALRIAGRRLLDRLGPHRVSVPAFGLFAAGLGGLCGLPAPGVLLAAGVACGAGHGSLFPVLGALAVARTPPRLHGTVMSLYTGALDLGAVVGTPVCGAIARVAGYRVMFATMAAASLAGLVLMAADRRRDRPPHPPL
jgi:MFS family permease